MFIVFLDFVLLGVLWEVVRVLCLLRLDPLNLQSTQRRMRTGRSTTPRVKVKPLWQQTVRELDGQPTHLVHCDNKKQKACSHSQRNIGDYRQAFSLSADGDRWTRAADCESTTSSTHFHFAISSFKTAAGDEWPLRDVRGTEVRPLSVLLIRVAPLVDYKTPSSFSMIVTLPGHREAKLPTNLLHRSDFMQRFFFVWNFNGSSVFLCDLPEEHCLSSSVLLGTLDVPEVPSWLCLFLYCFLLTG